MWNKLTPLVKNNAFKYDDEYLQNAKCLLSEEFIFQHVYNMEPSPIKYKLQSWFISPNDDPEWLYVLKRQEYLQDLIYAYLKTDDEIYLDKCKHYIFEWAKINHDDESKRYSTWRTIDTGIRLLNWSTAYNLLDSKGKFSAEEKEYLKQVINNQAGYLKENYIEKYDLSNWGVLITTGILTFDAHNPGVITSELVSWAEQKLVLELEIQVDDDGIHWEQSPLYFIEVFRSSLCVLASQSNSVRSSSKNMMKIAHKLELMYEALYYQVLPDGYILQQGDTDRIQVDDLMNSAAAILYGDNRNDNLDFLTYELLAGNDIPNRKFNTPKVEFDATISGNYFLKENQNYLHLFNGKIGSGHGHASNSHIDLTIDGLNVLVDPGRFTYVDGDIRRLLKSANSHNVTLIDDDYPIGIKDSWKFSKVLTNLGNRSSHLDKYDSYNMTYTDPEQNNYVSRYVIINKKQFACIVIDVISAKDGSKITQNWVLGPEISTVENKENKVLLNDGKISVFFKTDSELSIVNQKNSPRYNELIDSKKIEVKTEISNGYAVTHSIFGKNVESVKLLPIKQAGGDKDLKPENCYAIKVKYTDGEYDDIVLQHLNTYIGNKLFYVGDNASFGELNIFDSSNEKTFIF